MELKDIMVSPGMWIACSFIIATIIVQSIGFVKIALKGSREANMDTQRVKDGIRSAMLTAVGPTFAQVVILVSLLAVLGAPNTWMRVNDIGAPRSELTQVSNAASVYGVEVGTEGFTPEVFTSALWAMAVVNGGWMLVALLSAKRMGQLVEKMNKSFDPKWIKIIMSGSMMGLFAYLLSNNIVGKTNIHILAAAVSAGCMIIIGKVFRKNKNILSMSLGIALIIGVVVAGISKNML